MALVLSLVMILSATACSGGSKSGGKITESEVFGEAIYKFRMNCKIDMSSRPMITFAGERLCRENFEQMKKFLLLCLKIKSKFEENLKK